VSRITPPAAAMSKGRSLRFTDRDCIRLIRFQVLCIVAADIRANSPKGGDAKLPVYGHECLGQRGCRLQKLMIESPWVYAWYGSIRPQSSD
jgi:hypothetical protein